MASSSDSSNESTPLLHPRRSPHPQHAQDEEAHSILSSTLTKDEQHLSGSTIGERLRYNDYTTIDWLHDLVRYYTHSAPSELPTVEPFAWWRRGGRIDGVLGRGVDGGEMGQWKCRGWRVWTEDPKASFAIYVAMALVFGIVSSSVTMLTRSVMPSVGSGSGGSSASMKKLNGQTSHEINRGGKAMYMAAGKLTHHFTTSSSPIIGEHQS
ncbi:hypothetical protein IAQ61_005946 [Plenodomus lingam]|uniref:uncharacterized protein n=1 Tax=Leptosphaeria maculans TaxID=5022 RepID=UPI003329F974|nr:hypothetical protein IAQ61_005946 [Plenodomus lingam]